MMWTTRQRSDFGALRAIREGQGPTLLLLHGVGLRAEAWGAQIAAFAGDFTVIAPDMPGHGESPALVGTEIGLAAYAGAVEAALADVTEALVVGHSMGAMIALDLAARVPEKLRGVVALNAVHRRSPEARAAVAARAQALTGRDLPDPEPTLRRWFDDLDRPEAQACRAWLTAVDPAGYRAAYRVFAQEDGPAEATLAALARPALFMTGAQEPNSTPAMSRAMAALAPMGEARVVPGAAHMMPMTHATAVNAALAAFFARCAA